MVLYIRRALCLLALLLLSAQVTAETGKIWRMTDAITGQFHYGETSLQAFNSFCTAYGNCAGQCGSTTILSETLHRYSYNYYTPCSKSGAPTRDATFATTTCPAAYPYVDSSGNCVAQQQCPYGTVDIGTGGVQDCAEICPQGYSKNMVVDFGNIKNTITDNLGCEMTLQDGTTSCYLNTLKCNVTYQNTGNYSDSAPDTSDEEAPPDAPEGQSDETVTEQQTEPTVTSNPDGSTTAEQTYTKETQPEAESTIEKLGDNLYKKDSTGAYTDVVSQKTVNTYSDGSKTVTEETTTTKHTPAQTTTQKDLTSGQTTTTGTSSTSTSSTTTVTKTYNSSGVQTGQTTTTVGDVNNKPNTSTVGGTGDGEGKGGSGFCEYATPVCDFLDWFTAEEELPEAGELPVREIGENEITTGWTSGLPNTGNCPAPHTMTLLGASFELDYSLFCELAVQARPLVIAGAYLAAALILVGGLRR